MASPRQPDLPHRPQNQVERCWLCGIALPVGQLVPDGGSGCADVRWYCRDMRACTHRWTTTARPSAAGPGNAATSTARPSAAGPGNAATSTTRPPTADPGKAATGTRTP